MAIPDDALDKLGCQLQLRMDLAAGQTTMTYRIADGGKLKENRFAVVGEETLRTEHAQVPPIVERPSNPVQSAGRGYGWRRLALPAGSDASEGN
ncbi:MAG: DUF3108 domain-containing protein [Hahellaceae bacterium]|nr:DUF3108 domain-containing protein [Hahellaceae bacterium]